MIVYRVGQSEASCLKYVHMKRLVNSRSGHFFELQCILLLQAEELDDRKVQIVPPGFHVVFLPFADDLRKLKIDDKLPRGNLNNIQ
jgi:hypothetical protein